MGDCGEHVPMAARHGALGIHTVNVTGTFRYQQGPGVDGCLCMKESYVKYRIKEQNNVSI